MKKIITLLLIVTLLVGTLPVISASAENYATVYSGNQYGVRLREGPGVGYKQIVYVPSGTTVVLLESGSIWSRIQVGTTTGYMMSRYLVAGGSSSGVVIVATGTVTSGDGLRVWLRTAPNGKRIGLYSVGTSVGVITYGDEWCKVMIGSNIGYMMTKFLFFQAAPEPTPTPAPGKLTSMSVNYRYPTVGDVLKPVVTPTDATYTCLWEITKEGETTPTYTSTSSALTVLSSYLNMKIKLTVNGTGSSTGVSLSDTTAQVVNTKEITGVLINNTKSVTPVVGDVLTAVIAPSSATATYSWRVGGNEVSTAGTYTVLSSDAGKTIQVYVVGTGNYTGKANSLLTEKVASATQVVEVKLSTSYPVVGGTVSAVVRPSGANVTYAWTSGGVSVGTGASYTCVASDLGKQLQVTVKGKGDYTGSAVSALSNYVAKTLLTGVALNNTTPAVGETVKATVTPSGANATYEWYSYDSAGVATKLASGVSNTYVVTDAAKGKALYVVATGTGTYGGQVTSAKTSTLTDYTTITAIKINQANPVVGDTITATLTPSTAISDNGNVYLWYAGTSLAQITTEAKYTVAAADWNLPIYVQVNGGGTNTGSVKSGYTSKVANTKALSSVGFQYEDPDSGTGFTGLSGAPLINQTLKAVVSPAEAADQVNYTWTVSGSSTVVGSSQTLKVLEGWKGKTLTVTVKGQDTAKYTGTVSATTSAVPSTAYNLDLDLADTITPKAGKMPVTSIQGAYIPGSTTTRQWTATVAWAEALDIDGTFLAGQDYTAKVVFTPYTGYSLISAKTNDTDGSSQNMSVAGNIARYTFAAETDKTINIFNVTGLSAPSVGGLPDATITGNNQFTGTATWHKTEADAKAGINPVASFEAGETYYAKITLTAVSPYKLPTAEDGTPTITVQGARTATYNVAGGYIIASFNTTTSETKASLTASRTSVPVGSSDKKVQVTAYLSNYSGNQDDIAWNWTVNGQTKDETTIDKNGTLTISMDEPAPNTLTVNAKVTLNKVTYSASIDIALVAESTTTTTDNVTVQFIKAPSTVTVTPGSTATVSYVAMAMNANDEDVTWKVANKTDSNTTIANGMLTIGAKETASTLAITATSIANRAKSATVYLTINFTTVQPLPPSVTFTEKWGTMTPGSTKQFTAKCSYDSTGTITMKYIVSKGATVDASGLVTIDSTAQPDDIIAVSAVATLTGSTNLDGDYTGTCTIKVISATAITTKEEAQAAVTTADAAVTAAKTALSDEEAATPTLATLEGEQTAAQGALGTAQAALTDANDKLATAKSNLAAQQSLLATQLTTAQNKLAAAKTAQSNAESALSKANSALSTATEAKTLAETAKANANTALSEATSAQTAAETNLTNANAAETAAKNDLANAQAEQTAKKNAWDAEKAKPGSPEEIAAAEVAYNTATSKVNTAQAGVNTAKAAVTTATNALATAKSKVTTATANLVAAGKTADSATAAYDSAVKAQAAAQTASTAAQGDVTNAESELEALQSTLKTESEKVVTAENNVKTAESGLAAAQVALDSANAAVAEKEAKIAAAQNDVTNAEATLAAAKEVLKKFP